MHVERIGEKDWAAFREIRLRSLLDSPEAFGSTYGEESGRAERAWRDWAAGRWRGGAAAVFVGRDVDRAIVGTATGAAYDVEPGVSHVYAMWVAPDSTRSSGGPATKVTHGSFFRSPSRTTSRAASTRRAGSPPRASAGHCATAPTS
jgi:hypothetical protein